MKVRLSVVSLAFTLAFGGVLPLAAADGTQNSRSGNTQISAAEATNALVAMPPSTAVFEVGPVLVEQFGESGRPLILIPGLASGSWVWQDTVRQFKGNHTLYVLTLPGFSGRAARPGQTYDSARQAVQDLISSRKLTKPVLIGHSLGGIMALDLAQKASGQLAGVIAIDGLPVFPGSENMSLEQRQQAAQSMSGKMAAASPAEFVAQQGDYMKHTGVIDPALAAELAKLTAKSDPAATAQYMAEVFKTDLRPGLSKISVPVLLMAPYNPPDMVNFRISESMKRDYYKSLMRGTANLNVVTIAPARHFVMWDQSQKVGQEIQQFLQQVDKN
ncbi:MAG: hypothetical protein RL748_2811 [Pseudomonadota bacterium]